jgi:amidase
LPIGVQVVGRPWQEELVLAVAEEIERECGGYRQPGELPASKLA